MRFDESRLSNPLGIGSPISSLTLAITKSRVVVVVVVVVVFFVVGGAAVADRNIILVHRASWRLRAIAVAAVVAVATIFQFRRVFSDLIGENQTYPRILCRILLLPVAERLVLPI